jgi:hypothetical protein
MSDVSTTTSLKTEAIAAALSTILGSSPVTSYSNGKGKITFTSDQSKKFQTMIDSVKLKSGATDINIDFLPVVMPVVLKKTVPYILGLVAIGYVLGKI